ncbi:hotdog fold thioesterase [Deinococcus peraridilitoris]|uniref:Thioesterase domain-containing protein n=1 Tax=Deinococcus peraridilitoris (strain DSM 19664 / LMG 22246 / CIP 109416 / KR-200) TaxID=937777 RepID=K9ZZ32_DEIPD|nr:hotdog fold thioesterase [Deinococcus peraridilitoris]AFZ66015.1 hypothetical protein Deipe_0417 [Deinococcus peraridilitoris DSM 19664]
MKQPLIDPEVQHLMDQMGQRQDETLMRTLGIEFVEVSKERVVARMPVVRRVHQPFGLLHGGASVALAETVASVGAWLNVAERGQGAVGLEINANHLRGVREGEVTATATPLHRGRSTHVWNIEIVNGQGQRICSSRCTLAIVLASQDD